MIEKPDNIVTVDCELSIIMPCLNEEETIGICIEKALQFLSENGVSGEVIIADNNSSDNSVNIANSYNIKVVNINKRGYGSAIMGGIAASSGRYIIFADADDSYNFLELMPILEKLRQGNDLVMGNRFKGKILPGAMSPLHRYLGNPVLSWIGRLFFETKIGDFHSGLRGFSRLAYDRMDLQTTGMEFASEVVVKAALLKLKITEVPINLFKDGRSHKSHLRSFRDGWRHLRFLLLYSPRWLFFYPGILSMLVGFIGFLWVIENPNDLIPDLQSMLIFMAAEIIGFQTSVFTVLTKTFAVHEKLLPTNIIIEKILKRMTLEKGLIIGMTMVIIGLGGSLWSLIDWQYSNFKGIEEIGNLKYIIASITILSIGIQMIFSSFFYSMIQLENRSLN